ncbi:uncharacterized protein LOC122369325 [Amphibalanus amphitrite]|uniref:uncharacterized protein LOC122369325 n=1 Tax=Amphibalanus amphitrite TaxID=1232801 RepID=UPI001C916278|nr:uncharacterized protein LOC122369325 [Amphibalanus amphitrite]
MSINFAEGRHKKGAWESAAPLAAMAGLGAVLLLLLVMSAAADQYLDRASPQGRAVQTVRAGSKIQCSLKCETEPTNQCTGFAYDPDDGTCRLFSGDCRGPAVNSSQQTTDHYMARNTCPGTHSDRCACPAGFSRCAGRCLRRLGQTFGFTKSADRCAAIDAHLAVPRSDDENQCAMDVAVAAGKSVWLGLTDVVTEGQFVGADGCGVVSASGPQWGIGQPNDYQGQDYVGGHPMGWNDFRETEPCYPLCQLQFCYQPGCV